MDEWMLGGISKNSQKKKRVGGVLAPRSAWEQVDLCDAACEVQY
jgi:hypothetical protein